MTRHREPRIPVTGHSVMLIFQRFGRILFVSFELIASQIRSGDYVFRFKADYFQLCTFVIFFVHINTSR